MDLEYDVSGLADLYELLQSLPGKVEGNVMRGALRAGQKVLLDSVKARVPVLHGDLLASLRISFKGRSQKHGWVRMHLVVGNKVAWYPHLIEYGTASYYAGTGQSVGKPYEIRPAGKKSLFFAGITRTQIVHPGIKPQPFMRPGFDAGAAMALVAIKDYIAGRLPRELKKAGQT